MDVVGDVVSGIIAALIVCMILVSLSALWAWGTLLILAQVVRAIHSIRHGAPDYKYLRRMEAALFAENLHVAMEKAREREVL